MLRRLEALAARLFPGQDVAGDTVMKRSAEITQTHSIGEIDGRNRRIIRILTRLHKTDPARDILLQEFRALQKARIALLSPSSLRRSR